MVDYWLLGEGERAHLVEGAPHGAEEALRVQRRGGLRRVRLAEGQAHERLFAVLHLADGGCDFPVIHVVSLDLQAEPDARAEHVSGSGRVSSFRILLPGRYALPTCPLSD